MPPPKLSSKRSGGEKSNGNAEHDRLLSLAKENPWRLFDVGEIRQLFDLGEKSMTRLRKLSMKDPESDPWSGDKTRPEKFAEWFWTKRIDLEKANPNI